MRQNVAILWLVYAIFHVFTQWTTTLLPFLQWDTKPQMSMFQIGVIQATGSLCNAIGALVLGEVIDVFGSKYAFVVSTAITSFYYMGMGWANTFELFLLVQFFRIGYHFDASAEAYIATVTSEKERTHTILSLTIPIGFALVAGPVLASETGQLLGVRWSQMLCGCLALVVVIPLVIYLLPEPVNKGRGQGSKLRPQDYIPMILQNDALRQGLIMRLLVICPHIIYELITRQFLMRAYVKSPADSLKIYIGMGVGILLTQLVVLPAINRHRVRPKHIMQMTLICLSVVYILISSVRSFNQMIFYTCIQTAAYSLALAECSTQISTTIDQKDIGKATSLSSIMLWISHCIVPIYAGYLVTVIHYTYAFYTGAIMSIACFLLITFYCTHLNDRLSAILPTFGMGF